MTYVFELRLKTGNIKLVFSRLDNAVNGNTKRI